jgi:AcrR family transcriptional regulator
MSKEINRLYMELREYRGWRKQVAQRAGVTPSMVYWTLSGKGFDERIIDAALEVLAERRAHRQAVFDRVQRMYAGQP